ncbi:MAG: hypothetical protein KIT22_14060 [Verrucomicrobiae bacterium]|nr:hypothetical protein [Verrucomicrobiae bacterium]
MAWFAIVARAAEPSINREPYPVATSKKGLQVQMVEDALALGIRHAALNVNLAALVDPKGHPDNPAWEFSGRTYRFHRAALEALDQQIRPLSDRGVIVSLILLNYVSGDPDVRRLLQHPAYDTNCPNHLSAFNTSTAEARNWLSAAVEMMAARWSRPDGLHGRVWNWIVGNEVNSHWFWSNMGRVTLEEFTGDYLRAVRLVHQAVRRQSLHGRVYVSLEHHWNIRYPGGDAGQAFPGRDFLDLFARLAAEGGDFDWHVAFHPYPEDLFNPRSWNDASATPDWRTTPRITFRNLDQLIRYLEQPELRHAGNVRRVILSEQGFHTPEGPDGETVQAAAYVYAWKQVAAQPGIDAFILHRHVDHAHEGGLRLGLWRRAPDSVCTPSERKRIYEVFRLADTASADEAFAFAASIIGAPRTAAP